jgi:16S rRNA processing protein RimM
MKITDFAYHIADIVAVHGYDGTLKIVFKEAYLQYVQKNTLFFCIHDKPVPFFFHACEEIAENICLMSFDDINSREKARTFLKTKIYLPKKDIPLVEIPVPEIEFVREYSLKDQNNREIGTIKDIVENKGQSLLIVQSQEKEILIPYHKDLFISRNTQKKSLTLHISEGLLNL